MTSPPVRIALALTLAASGTSTLNAQAAPLQVRDVLGIRRFPENVQVDLSPDGKFVAFTLRNPTRVGGAGNARFFTSTGAPVAVRGTDVYVAEVLTAKATNLTGDRGANWSPTWSPDGKTLALISDRDGVARVWVWGTDRSRRFLRRVSPEQVRGYSGFEGIRWSPNGRKIAVKLYPAGMGRTQLERLLPVDSSALARTSSDSVTATVFTAQSADSVAAPFVSIDSTRSLLNAELADLAIIDVNSGRVKRLATRVRVTGWQWSPDGTRIAFSTRQPQDATGRGPVYDNYDLFVVDTVGKQPPRLVAPHMVQENGLEFSWSPSGRALAFQSGGTLNVVAREGGDIHKLTGDERSFAHEIRAPLWLNEETLISTAGDTVWKVNVRTGDETALVVPSDRRLLEIIAPADAQRLARPRLPLTLLDPVTKMTGFRNLDLTTGAITGRYDDEVGLGASSLPFRMDVSADGKTIAFVAERGDRPAEIWISPEEFTHATRITNLNPQITRQPLGGTRLVQWTGPAGDVQRGALLMPSNYEPGKRAPLIVKVFGGERQSNRLNRFGLDGGVDNLHLLATRGYAVLLPDLPVRVGTPMADIAASVLAAIDTIVAIGVADPTRLGIIGHDYGGYSVFAVLVQTNRFKAAVSSGGFSNLLSQYGVMRSDGSTVGASWAEGIPGRMGGTPWEFRDRYIDNSPFFFLDRVRTPVLLLHGGADRTVLPARAEETFVALRRLGRDATLVEYAGEDHQPASWSTANQADYWARIFDWFEKYLSR